MERYEFSLVNVRLSALEFARACTRRSIPKIKRNYGVRVRAPGNSARQRYLISLTHNGVCTLRALLSTYRNRNEKEKEKKKLFCSAKRKVFRFHFRFFVFLFLPHPKYPINIWLYFCRRHLLRAQLYRHKSSTCNGKCAQKREPRRLGRAISSLSRHETRSFSSPHPHTRAHGADTPSKWE